MIHKARNCEFVTSIPFAGWAGVMCVCVRAIGLHRLVRFKCPNTTKRTGRCAEKWCRCITLTLHLFVFCFFLIRFSQSIGTGINRWPISESTKKKTMKNIDFSPRVDIQFFQFWGLQHDNSAIEFHRNKISNGSHVLRVSYRWMRRSLRHRYRKNWFPSSKCSILRHLIVIHAHAHGRYVPHIISTHSIFITKHI